MTQTGDRIVAAVAKGAPSKRGTVITQSGSLLTVRWDDGHESSFCPAPGSVTVETSKPGDTSG